MILEITLIVMPFVLALVCVFVKTPRVYKITMLTASLSHIVLTLSLPFYKVKEGMAFGADSLSYVFLMILTLLYLASTINSIHFIENMQKRGHIDLWYVPSMLLFLSSMTGVILSRNLGMMWVFIEATTLSSAALINHRRDREAVEAVWKYLFICSIGIAFAFIGVMALIAASKNVEHVGLNIDKLVQHAAQLSPQWLGIGFVFALIGYGTKMGLAPMHTWLPDAHSQAPSPASALFSGSLLNCAFLAILRYYQIMSKTNMITTAKDLLLILGLLSLLVCAVYINRVPNFKRKLAYSSIEHVGILATGIGLGGGALYAAMLHAVCHSLSKHLMFLTSGNILHSYLTVDADKVKNMINRLPATSWLLMLGAFALLGFPPFGAFISEFLTIKEMALQGRWYMLTIFVILIAAVSYGMIKAVIEMVFSPKEDFTDEGAKDHSEPLLSIAPQWVFIAALLVLGIYIPEPIDRLFRNAAFFLIGGF
ncbi:NADH dehydrogenase (quinone) [Candidatus Magnetoovum chiemensis]|nr:NADH dehydrogenase (quinone) [Candidatus Magnetoovum chiemensis]